MMDANPVRRLTVYLVVLTAIAVAILAGESRRGEREESKNTEVRSLVGGSGLPTGLNSHVDSLTNFTISRALAPFSSCIVAGLRSLGGLHGAPAFLRERASHPTGVDNASLD